jgi:hypothetical protein
MRIVAPFLLSLSLSLISVPAEGRREFPTQGSPYSGDTSNQQARNAILAQSIANNYVKILNLTSWSMELAKWIEEHGYKGVVDTFQETDWHRWEFEKYCFKTKIETEQSSVEYSFFDNGDFQNPKAILGQVVIFDRRTNPTGGISQGVWDTISDSMTSKYGRPSSVPKNKMLTPFDLGVIRHEWKPRSWQDGVERIVLAEYFRFEGGGRKDVIMLLSRGRALDSLLHRNQAVEFEYTGLFRRVSHIDDICDSLRSKKTPLKRFCGSDLSAKDRLAALIRCGIFISGAERAGDSADLPLYRMALYVFGASYHPQGNGDQSGPWNDVDTLKHYNVTFQWDHLGGGWEYSDEPLNDIYTRYSYSRWGKVAFVMLQNVGWCPEGMCNGNNGPTVVSRGEEFLERYPDGEFTPEILLTIAKGHETNWNVSTCSISGSDYMYDPNNRSDEVSRLKAIATYERILTEFPKSPEAEISKVRLPRLKLGINTGRRDYFFIHD